MLVIRLGNSDFSQLKMLVIVDIKEFFANAYY